MAIAAVAGFLGYKLHTLITKSDTTKIKKGFFRDLDKGEPTNYTLGHTKFDFAFKVDVGGVLTPSIGKIELNHVLQYYTDDGSKICPAVNIY